MTTAGPWSVKGIDPKAREIAKDLARRSGLTLGEWLNQMITDTSDDAGPPIEKLDPRLDPRIDPWAEPPAPLARGPDGQGAGFGAESFRARLQNVGRAAEAVELSRVTRALNELTQRMEAAEHRSTLAISGIDQQVMGVLSRIEDGERDASATAARFDGALDEVRSAQEKIAARLARVDVEDAPRVEAMKSLESALARMAAQIYEGESRGRAQTSEVREDVSALARRVEQAEAAAQDAARAADAKAFEAALARITERLDAAEAKTSAAVAALETSFASLDSRTSDARARGGEDLDARFSSLAAELQAKVEGERSGIADRLRAAAADPKLDRMEGALRDLSAQVGEAEKRSAAAIDRMGHEIIRIASNMHGRMEKVEVAGAEVIDRMGGEMAKFAEVIENRARRTDDMQAEALERLGGEIAKIAEKLTDRIGSSERRAAQAMNDLGEQLEGAADRLNARYDVAIADVAERLRRSEEKTRVWLDEARVPTPAASGFDPAPPAPSFSAAPTAFPAASAAAYEEDEAFEPTVDLDPFAHIGASIGSEIPPRAAAQEPEAYVAHDPFAALEADLAARAALARDPFPEAPAAPAPQGRDPFPSEPLALDAPASPSSEFGRQPEPSAFPSAFDAFDVVEPPPQAPAAPAFGHDEELFAAAPAPAPRYAEDPARDDPRRDSTRDLIAAARAAAREAAEAKGRRGKPAAASIAAPAATPSAPPLPGLSPLQPADARKSSGFSLSLPRRRKRDAGTLRTLAYASGVAVTITMAAVGAANIASHAGEGQDGGEAPSAAPGSAAPVQTASAQTASAQTASAQTAAAPANATAASTLAMAVAPAEGAGEGSAPLPTLSAPPITAAPSAVPAASATGSLEEARLVYSTAVRRLEGGDAAGLPDLRRAANLGLPQAQFHLANLYEDGKAGLPKDPVQARAWMARAASGGESRAMFNLGLFYANGEGGQKDDRSAVAWFRRAADLGLHDAQFNLAVMSQDGRGAPKSAAEAYKWFLIAAANGDVGAKASAEALKPQLAADALAAAERSAAAYKAAGKPATAAG